MSEQVMTQAKPQPVQAKSHTNSVLQRQCACGQHTAAGGECEECRKKSEGTIQRAAVSSASTGGVPPIVHEVLNSAGQSLDAGTRAFMEPRFGHDFSGVRVHTNEKAAQSARAVNALAYTVGRDVVFGAGQYTPGTMEGRRLLAHELTHVVQQVPDRTSGMYRANALQMGEPDDRYELEAEVADRQATMAETVDFTDQQANVGAVTALQRHVLQRQRDVPEKPEAQEREKPKESTIPTIKIPVFDELDPMVIVPDFIPVIGGKTMKLSDVRKAIDILQGKRSDVKDDGFCAKFNMEPARFGGGKVICCPKRVPSPRRDECCPGKDIDIFESRCCTPQEIHYQGRCIKLQPALPEPKKPLSPEVPHLQLETPRIRTGTTESLTIDHFAVDGDKIPSGYDYGKQLDHLAGLLKIYPGAEVHIEGHTDSTYTPEHNKRLSKQRAESVKNALISRGVNKARLIVEGFGEGRLLFPEERTEEEKASNRRVEIWFSTPPSQKLGEELHTEPLSVP